MCACTYLIAQRSVVLVSQQPHSVEQKVVPCRFLVLQNSQFFGWIPPRQNSCLFEMTEGGLLFSRSATIRVNRHDDSYLVAVLSVCHCIVSAYISTQ